MMFSDSSSISMVSNKMALVSFLSAILGGVLGGGIGALSNSIEIFDRFTKPNVEITGILPILTWKKISDDHTAEGLSFIVGIKNEQVKPAYVTGLEISGKINLNKKGDIMMFKLDEASREKQYFAKISWKDSYIKDQEQQTSSIKIEPHDERYIKFVFSDPINSGDVYKFDGDTNTMNEYLGNEDDNIKPRIIYDPNPNYFFINNSAPNFRPERFRPELSANEIKIELILGNKKIKIDNNQIKKYAFVTEEYWNSATAKKIYHDNMVGVP
jgi:hypothetical protein